MLLQELVKEKEDFVTTKEKINHSTGMAYNNSLNYFLYYLHQTNTNEITQYDINKIVEAYKSELNNGLTIEGKHIQFKANTMNTHLRRLETFLRSLNFKVSVNKFRANKVPYKALDYDQIILLINECKFCFKNSELAKRTEVLIKFMFNTGFRINETLGIKLEHLLQQGSNYYALIHEKGKAKNELTRIMISQGTYELLMDYVESKSVPSDYLFSSLKESSDGKAKQLTRQVVSRNITKLGKYVDNKHDTNISETLENNTTHFLRHSKSVYLLNEKNCDVVEVQKILRHTSINTTMAYLDKKEETIDNIRISNDIL